MIKGIYHSLTERKQQHKKSFAVLIDPDKVNDSNLEQLIELAVAAIAMGHRGLALTPFWLAILI